MYTYFIHSLFLYLVVFCALKFPTKYETQELRKIFCTEPCNNNKVYFIYGEQIGTPYMGICYYALKYTLVIARFCTFMDSVLK